MLAALSKKTGIWHYGEAVRESAAAAAERIVREELAARRWQESTLTARRKGDAEKLMIAQRLRRETTMTLAWIAARLQMGSASYLAHLFYWNRRAGK